LAALPALDESAAAEPVAADSKPVEEEHQALEEYMKLLRER
jgi:hypothetical protein